MQVRIQSRARTLVVVALVVLSIVLVSCGSDGDTASSSSGPTTTSTDASGSSFDPDLPPFRIGWANMDEGTIPQPALTDGALAAAAYANEHLGGIDGREIKLVTCSLQATNESAQACGQRFANDSSLQMAMMGISVNGGPYYAALAAAGVPVQGLSPVSVADFSAPDNVTWTYGGGAAQYVGIAELAKRLKAKTIAVLYLDNSGGVSGLKDLRDALEGEDVEFKVAAVAPTSSDALPPLASTDAANADLVVLPNNCLPFARALKTLGAKGAVTAVNSCFTAANLKSAPADFEGWYAVTYARNPLEKKGSNKEMDTFLEEYPRYAKLSAEPIGTNAQIGWGGILTLRNALAKADAKALDDRAALGKVLRSFTGPAVLGSETLKCPGGNPTYPSVCTLDNTFYRVKGGAFVPM